MSIQPNPHLEGKSVRDARFGRFLPEPHRCWRECRCPRSGAPYSPPLRVLGSAPHRSQAYAGCHLPPQSAAPPRRGSPDKIPAGAPGDGTWRPPTDGPADASTAALRLRSAHGETAWLARHGLLPPITPPDTSPRCPPTPASARRTRLASPARGCGLRRGSSPSRRGRHGHCARRAARASCRRCGGGP